MHIGQVELNRSVVAQLHEELVVSRQFLVLLQSASQLGRLLGGVGEDAVEGSVLRHQLRGRLLPHARNAGQVVARVSSQGGVGRILLGSHTGLLDDAGLVVERVVGDASSVVQNPNVRIANELITVAVAGDDHDVESAVHRPVGHGGDDVVGFETRNLDHRNSEGRQDLADDSELLTKDVGSRLALRLVLGLGFVAERRLRTIERDHQTGGSVILQHRHQHRGETEHCVGDLATGRDHVGRQAEERAIRERIAVEEEKSRSVSGHGTTSPDKIFSATSRMRERSFIAVRWMNANASCSL